MPHPSPSRGQKSQLFQRNSWAEHVNLLTVWVSHVVHWGAEVATEMLHLAFSSIFLCDHCPGTVNLLVKCGFLSFSSGSVFQGI